tara:strand:- start:159 stop:1082 length:924 start_codon:yes stop_codon:yes gene_type:complete
MLFKKNNPGSPCCNCCPCYPLDTSGANVSGTVALENKDGGPEWNSSAKKLGEGSASFKYGTGYLEAADHDCFSPYNNPDGWAMSFWIKPVTNIPVVVCSTSTPLWQPGVITKGYWTHAVHSSVCTSVSALGATTHGEWFIVAARTSENPAAPVQLFVYVNCANSTGGSTWSFLVAGAKRLDTRSGIFGTDAAEWNFVYWYIRGGHSWVHIRGETESIWQQFYRNTNTFGGIKNESVPLRVGTMIEGSNEYRLGAQNGSYLIDNILFDDNPTTYGSTSLPIPSPPSIPVEATALYNSGSGKKCPQVGR